jgi:PhnB protein
MKLTTQLAFKGQCREAFERYAKVLGGTITVMNTLGDTDAPLPPGSRRGPPHLVRFAQLDVGDQTLLGNDLPDADYEPMRGFNVALHTRSVDDATRIFNALADGGRVLAPLTEMPWARRFGQVRDRYGVPWLILALRD